MYELIDAPVPYLLGMCSVDVQLIMSHIPTDVYIVDLDNDRILTKSNSPISWKYLPADLECALRTRLTQISSEIITTTNAKSNNTVPLATVQKTMQKGEANIEDEQQLKRTSLDLKTNRIIRDVFLRFMCYLLRDLKRYLKPIELNHTNENDIDPSIPMPPISHDIHALLDIDRFIASSSNVTFYTELCKTQNFTQLVSKISNVLQNESLEKKCQMTFFVACIDLVNVQVLQISGPSVTTPSKKRRPRSYKKSGSKKNDTALTMADHALLVSVEHHQTLFLEDCVEVTLTTDAVNKLIVVPVAVVRNDNVGTLLSKRMQGGGAAARSKQFNRCISPDRNKYKSVVGEMDDERDIHSIPYLNHDLIKQMTSRPGATKEITVIETKEIETGGVPGAIDTRVSAFTSMAVLESPVAVSGVRMASGSMSSPPPEIKEGMLGEEGSQGTMSMLERFRLRSLRDVEKNEVCREMMEEDENQMVDEKDVVVGDVRRTPARATAYSLGYLYDEDKEEDVDDVEDGEAVKSVDGRRTSISSVTF